MAVDRSQQQRVKPLSSVGKQRTGPIEAVVVCVVANQPVQREPYPVDQLIGPRRGAKLAYPELAADHCNDVQHVIETNELKQCRIAKGVTQPAYLQPPTGAGSLFRWQATVVVTDPPLQRHLPMFQCEGLAARATALEDLANRDTQFRECSGEIRIAWGADRSEHQMAGPALLGPFQHASRLAAVKGHTQPELGQFDPMPGGMSAQICSSQAGSMLVQDAQRPASGSCRAAAVAADPAVLRLCIPALGTLQGRSSAALPRRLLKLHVGSADPASLDGKLASQEPGLEGGRRPPGTGQVSGRLFQGPDAYAGPCIRLLTGSQPGPKNREAGKRYPTGTPLVVELAHRHAGLLQSEAGLPVQDGDLRQ